MSDGMNRMLRQEGSKAIKSLLLFLAPGVLLSCVRMLEWGDGRIRVYNKSSIELWIRVDEKSLPAKFIPNGGPHLQPHQESGVAVCVSCAWESIFEKTDSIKISAIFITGKPEPDSFDIWINKSWIDSGKAFVFTDSSSEVLNTKSGNSIIIEKK
jgi:hypothetical protein